MLVWACTENGKKQNSQKGITYEFRNNKAEADQEIDGKMKWGRMKEQLVEKGI